MLSRQPSQTKPDPNPDQGPREGIDWMKLLTLHRTPSLVVVDLEATANGNAFVVPTSTYHTGKKSQRT